MKAFVFAGERRTAQTTRAKPVPAAGQVVIRSRTSSICGTDLHQYRHNTTEPNGQPRFIAGHESVGDVVGVGPDVQWPHVGDRVVGYPVIGCGHCEQCRILDYRNCPHSLDAENVYGIGRDGSNAEYVLLSHGQVLPLPDDFSYEDGAVLSCNFGTAWSAVRAARLGIGGVLAVWGLGPVGLNVVLVARAAGARVIGIDVSVGRRDAAEALGAVVLDGGAVDLAQRIAELTEGKGPHAGVDTTGVGAVHATMADVVRRRGRLVLVAGGPQASLAAAVPLRELTIVGVWIYAVADWTSMLEFVRSHELQLTSVVGRIYPIDDFDLACQEADSASQGKIILRW